MACAPHPPYTPPLPYLYTPPPPTCVIRGRPPLMSRSHQAADPPPAPGATRHHHVGGWGGGGLTYPRTYPLYVLFVSCGGGGGGWGGYLFPKAPEFFYFFLNISLLTQIIDYFTFEIFRKGCYAYSHFSLNLTYLLVIMIWIEIVTVIPFIFEVFLTPMKKMYVLG